MSCSVCQDEKSEQVTLRCGHNFCQKCVTLVLSTPEEFGISACEECQEWVHEQQKKEELPNPSSSPSEANPDSSPSEANPDSSPSEANPDSSPSEANPDSSPSEANPDSSPSEANPDSSPSEANPDSSPSEENPDSSPSKANPYSSPSEEYPYSSPSEANPDSSPSEENPDSSPSEENPDSSPSEENPYSSPTEENPYSSPTEENPYSSPTEENPYSSPTEENPNSSPTEENPYSSPTEENPNSSPSETEGSGVFCTYCMHTSILAVKYCLRCEASLCAHHLLVHRVSPKHILRDPATSPHNQNAFTHKGSGEVMTELFLKKLSIKKEETEKRVLSLWEHREKVRRKAEGVTDGVNVLFRKLRKKLKQLQNKVLKETSRQEVVVSQSVSDLIQKLEMETADLSRKICALHDPSYVLEDDDFRDIDKAANTKEDLEDEAGDVDEESLMEIIHKGLFHMITAVSPEIRTPSLTRVQLDMNTAADTVCISDDLKAASWSVLSQNRPVTPQRFESFQVLSSTVFPLGRYYWQVETSSLGNWRVGVCYPSIERGGDMSVIGSNDRSWCVCQICDNNDVVFHSAKHNRENAALPVSLTCKRLGIYLDYEEGRLSFYELDLPIRHLHTFTTTFTEPLHAAIYVCGEEQQCPTWVRFMD